MKDEDFKEYGFLCCEAPTVLRGQRRESYLFPLEKYLVDDNYFEGIFDCLWFMGAKHSRGRIEFIDGKKYVEKSVYYYEI